VLVDAYRKLGMLDLADNVEKVYVENYPVDAKLVQNKKPWWKFF